jgi:phage FluMu protein Com
MRTQDVRCPGCGILLARLDETGLTVRRNDLEVHYGGPGQVSLRCYRPRCRKLHVIRLAPATSPGGAVA